MAKPVIWPSIVDSWDQIMDGTRWLPEDQAELVEIIPDQDYRSRKFIGPPVMVKSLGRWNHHHQGDVDFLKKLKLLVPNNGEIYPLGILLDLCEKRLFFKRQPAHSRLRRLWKKGMIRRYELPDKDHGVWYKLEEQEGFFVNKLPPPMQITIEELF